MGAVKFFLGEGFLFSSYNDLMRGVVVFVFFSISFVVQAGLFVEPYLSTIFTQEGVLLNNQYDDQLVRLDYYENQGILYGGKIGVEWGSISFGGDFSYSKNMKRKTSNIGTSIQKPNVFEASFLGYFLEFDLFGGLSLGSKYYDKVKLKGDYSEVLFGALGFYGTYYFSNDLGLSFELRKLKSDTTLDKNEIVFSISVPLGRASSTAKEIEE